MTLLPGSVVADRFTVRSQAGRGGMGAVYQAIDTLSGRPVALKLMHATADAMVAQRFTREAQVLSGLSHPGIVSYVAHGLAAEGQPYLAMEWLEGEDLARRLARQPLALSDTLALLARAANALAYAHAQGIVHRDIKPSNLFLRGSRAEDVVLLDFGLARIVAASQHITGSMMVLGTPGYMAPEQASSQEDITPSADIFSLGCVLYECLTGQAPFHAPHLAAVLAKILYTEAPLLRVRRPELPASLQWLVDKMLVKDPRQRLADGEQLLGVLRAWKAPQELPPPARKATPAAPTMEATDTEQQLVSVVLAAPGLRALEASASAEEAEEASRRQARIGLLLQELRDRGASATLLADKSLLATFLLDRGTATDQAAVAASCAQLIKERWPESSVVLTTGLSLRGRPLPAGEVMDRAGNLLRHVEHQGSPMTSLILLDDTTAGLLGPEFPVDKAVTGSFLLRGERLSVDESRPLLGRPTPCVGREQELSLLEITFASCVEDAEARAILVTAPAGAGKSRLRHEFLRRLEQRGRLPLVLLGRGEPMNAGSAYSVLGSAVRRLCGVVVGEPQDVQREKLARRVGRHLGAEQVKDTIAFLGELCGVPVSLEESPKLRAAREDPRLMSQQITRAMVSLLRAESSQGPLLLVLEDLHWSDISSVRLMDEVLAELRETPLMVLALARPEVKELFPRLWGRWLQEVPLRGLSQKASARLVQEMLGSQASPSVVTRLVEQAAGNALFLEELIRSVAEGHEDELPATVLAMLQSRLQRLEPGSRRVLLAASILGRTFWKGGVRALLDDDMSAEELEQRLHHMVELEMVERQSGSRFPSEIEYRFRHALVRDAAYSLVSDRLKLVGHLRAGAWFEQAGELDPLVLARHYQLGQSMEKAAWLFTRASERLLERQDLQGAQRCLEAALACEPKGSLLVDLRALETVIAFWAEDYARAYEWGSKVRPELRPGSAAWGRVMGALMLVGAQSGRVADLRALRQIFLATSPEPEAISLYMQAAGFLVFVHAWHGQPQQAAAVLERMDQVSSMAAGRDGMSQGWLYCAHGYFEHFYQPRPWRSRTLAEQASQAFREVNRDSNQVGAHAVWGLALVALGDVSGAVSTMREALVSATRYGLAYSITYTQAHLALVLASSAEASHHEEARLLALRILETEKVNKLHLGIAHLTLAKVAAFQGQLSDAEARARASCEVLGALVPYQLMARNTLCALLLAQQRVEESRAEAEQGVRTLRQMGEGGAVSVGAWLALAEACLAQEDLASADSALREGLGCVRERASDIPTPEVRERFLRQMPENARTLELARQRLGVDWDGQSGA